VGAGGALRYNPSIGNGAANGTFKVLVADEHAPIRETVDADPRFTVVAVAGDAAGAIQAALRERPDLALLDLRIAGGGAAAAWEITSRLPATRAVMLAASFSDEDLFAALRAGAAGCLVRAAPFDGLGERLARVLDGEVALDPKMVTRLVAEFRDSGPRRRHVVGEHLTSREWQVLDMLRQGLGTGEIARRLFVSPTTVRSHVAAVLRKLGVPDRDAAVRLFAEPAGSRPPGV
jgi:DNA-binding NarL/FixJ family response regulator